MKIKTRCDSCGKVYNMASEYIGRTAQCKRCQNHFIMNPYTPPTAAAETAPQPQTVPAPQPAFNSQPARETPAQHPMADQTILPNAGMGAASAYAPPQPQVYQPPQTSYPSPTATSYVAQPDFQTRPQFLSAARTQTALCLKCGHSVEIPIPAKRMKITCQACGAKVAVGPEAQKATGKSGGPSSKSVLLLLILILILAGGLFLGPTFFPEIFPDLIGDLLPN